jgi:membrane associated rhomboid family serine protease
MLWKTGFLSGLPARKIPGLRAHIADMRRSTIRPDVWRAPGARAPLVLPRPDSRTRLRRLGITTVSHGVVAACITVFVVLGMLDAGGLWPRGEALGVLGLSADGLLRHGRLWQPVTSVFVHADPSHLGFNMLTLWMLGPDVELVLGRARYLVFSAACAVAGGVGFLACSVSSGAVACGYSGVVYGLLVAQAMYFPHRRVSLFGAFPLRTSQVAVIFGAVELYLSVMPDGRAVAHAAHVTAALCAWVILGAGRRMRRAAP